MAGSGDRVRPSASLDLDGVRAQMALAGAGERDSTAASAPNHARDYKVTLKCDGVVPCVEKWPGKT